MDEDRGAWAVPGTLDVEAEMIPSLVRIHFAVLYQDGDDLFDAVDRDLAAAVSQVRRADLRRLEQGREFKRR